MSELDFISLNQLELEADIFNAYVQSQAEIDHFCSCTWWAISAHLGFAPHRRPLLWRGPAGYATFVLQRAPRGIRLLEPLESTWGLAFPFVGPDPEALISEFAEAQLTSMLQGTVLVVRGHRAGGSLEKHMVKTFAPFKQARLLPSTFVHLASLEGGFDGFLSRRKAKFRKNYRRGQRLLKEAGITFDWIAAPASSQEALALYQRIVQIERKSWKGQSGTGIVEPLMYRFYQQMMVRMWSNRLPRVVIARQGEDDVGFVLGACHRGTFRGLQASYDDRYSRMSLGSALHLEMIRGLCEQGCLVYDMGVDNPYKDAWAEEQSERGQLFFF